MQRRPGASEADSEDWVISYADLVTVLLCFFILFFSDASEDAVLEEIAEIFTVEEDKFEDKPTTGASYRLSRDEAKMMAHIESRIENEIFGLEQYSVEFGFERNRNELVLRILEKNFFEMGNWDLTRVGRKILRQISEQLMPFNERMNLTIEAHTDSIPVQPNQHFLNNLSLSALRASTAANVLLKEGLSEQHIFVKGYGSTMLLFQDQIDGKILPDQASRNRRIEIRIWPLEQN